MEETRAELNALLSPKEGRLDILRIREIARAGLPDRETRAKVWPLLVGLDESEVEDDTSALEKFTEVHNNSKQMAADYDVKKMAYLAANREYLKRKEEFERKLKASKDWEPDTSETEPVSEESGDLAQNEELTFTEEPPEAPPLPDFPIPFWDQIGKDVERSLWKQVGDDERPSKRAQLHRIICAVLYLVKDDEGKPLHYFQGYHDIAAVCLLTCGEGKGFSLLKRLSTTYLRDQMQDRIDYVMALLKVLFPLVSALDHHIGRFLEKSGVQPYAALPWVMTWFSHVLENQALSERMFDLFLASPSWMPLYLTAAVVVFMSSHGLYACPCEFSEVHNFFSRFASRSYIPWEDMIKDALRFYTICPPSSIKAQSFMPEDSRVLQYPYYWVPKNEVLYTPTLSLQAKIAIGTVGFIAVSAIVVGVAFYLR